MGGGTSKFDATDWKRASGGLKSSEETIDGAAPTPEYQVLHLVKRRGILTNQREFDLINASSSTNPEQLQEYVLYTTRSVPGTLAWFDVLGPNPRCGNTSHPVLLLRVQADLPRRTWTVFRYHEPIFEGQRPASLEPRLYKSACITVSWSRYVAVMARYGSPSIEYLAHLHPDTAMEQNDEGQEAATSLTSLSTTDDNGFEDSGSLEGPSRLLRTASSDDDDDDDFFLAAKEVAAKIRKNKGNDESIANDSISSSDQPASPTNDEIRRTPSTTDKAKRLISNAVNSCACPSTGNKTGMESPESMLYHPEDIDQRVAEAMLSAKRTDPLGNPLNSVTFTSSTTASPSSFTQYVSSQLFGSTNDKATVATSKITKRPQAQRGTNREERRKEIYLHAMEGVIDLDGPMVECQEIYNKIIGNHQTSLIGKDQVRRLLQWDGAQHQSKTQHNNSSMDDDDNNNNPIVQAMHQDEKCHGQDPPEGTPDDWMKRVGQSMASMGLTCDADVTPPLTVDSPPPQQAPKPLLKTPGQNNSHNDNNNEFEASLASIVAKQRHSSRGWLGGQGSPKKVQPSIQASSPHKGMIAAAEVTRSLQEAAISAALQDAPSAPIVEGADCEKNQQQQEPKDEHPLELTPVVGLSHEPSPTTTTPVIEPLMGYWSWKNTYTVHKMELHLAQNSDLALHLVLAIVCNQVRSERNAVALSV